MNRPTKRALKQIRDRFALQFLPANNEPPNEEGTETRYVRQTTMAGDPNNEPPNEEGTETYSLYSIGNRHTRPTMNRPTKRALKRHLAGQCHGNSDSNNEPPNEEGTETHLRPMHNWQWSPPNNEPPNEEGTETWWHCEEQPQLQPNNEPPNEEGTETDLERPEFSHAIPTMNRPTKRALKHISPHRKHMMYFANNEPPNEEGTETRQRIANANEPFPNNEPPNEEGTETYAHDVYSDQLHRPTMNRPTKRALKPYTKALAMLPAMPNNEPPNEEGTETAVERLAWNDTRDPTMNRPTKRALKHH